MDGPYRVINSIIAHDGGPIRSITLGPHDDELITGCQSDAPNLKRWKISDDYRTITEIGSAIYHDHWVTALTVLKKDESRPFYPQGCIISGCMDSLIRVFDADTSELLAKLEGHSKGVISFSWTVDGHLISGSWDGTAKIWDLQTSRVLKTLGPHENGVHVLGLKNGLIVTTSTGESVDGKPANFQIRYWDPITGRVQGDTIRDHQGSIRSIAPLPGMDGILTGSNDGTVMMRSIEGQPIEILMHPLQDDGSPPFVLDCSAIPSDSGMDFVSGAEDGSVVVWSGGERVQSIPHPNTVWTVLGLPPLPSAQAMSVEGDDNQHSMYFATGGHDGVLRIFTNDPLSHSDPMSVQLSSAFVTEVTEAKRKKTSGPSAEEIAKAPKWEQRSSHPGKSENQVMVFNQNGQLIAAQWTSGAWVCIGEVTGTGDGEYINGVWYDHVFPVEIETSQGVKTLKLGYNNQENPFIAAQRFIDTHGLQQTYLQQIADWILQRAGKSATPTIGGGGGHSQGHGQQQHHHAAPPAPPMTTPPTPMTASLMKKFPNIIRGYCVFDDVPNVVKCMGKVREFNDAQTNPSLKLTETHLTAVEGIVKVLSESNRYHASEIDSSALIVLIHQVLARWSHEQIFVAFDLLRLIAIHPQASELLSKNKSNCLDMLLQQLTTVLTHTAGSSHATVLTGIRCAANMLKSESLRRVLYSSSTANNSHVQHAMPQLVLDSMKNHGKHTNKLVRAAVMTFALNYVASKTVSRSATIGSDHEDQRVMDGIVAYALIMSKEEQEYALVSLRALQILGSLLVSTTYTALVVDKIAVLRDSVQHAQSMWTAKANQEVVAVAKEVFELL